MFLRRRLEVFAAVMFLGIATAEENLYVFVEEI